MRALSIFLLALLFSSLAASAQEKSIQAYDGIAPKITDPFTVQDKWELRWHAPGLLSVTIVAQDGSIVAGTAGMASGSLYVPKGGTYTLHVSGDPKMPAPWHVAVVEIGSATALAADASMTSDYVPPVLSPATGATNSAAATAPVPSNVATTTSAATNTVVTTTPPASNVAAGATPDGLTQDQAHAIVVIKGDNAEGTGFIVKMPDGLAVITNQHVISANPNIHILTSKGEEIQVLSMKAASDRDLAMLLIKDNHYSFLLPANDLSNQVQTGDQVITPGNSEGGEVVLNTKGKILGIGPVKIEFDNPIYHGNSGGPVFHLNSGKVVGVVTEAEKVDTSDDVDHASFNNKNSAIAGSMRYFGLRIDNVAKWEPIDWNNYLSETTFLDSFHQETRCLDSFLNGDDYEKAKTSTAGEEGDPDSNYYLRDPRIEAAYDAFKKMQTDADDSQKMDAQRQIVMTLQGFADEHVNDISNAGNFYTFDQTRAKDELEYRKWIKDEVDKFGDHISDMGH